MFGAIPDALLTVGVLYAALLGIFYVTVAFLGGGK